MADPRPLTVEQENEIAQGEALAYKRRVRDAFVGTFGPPGQRTPLGVVMLEALEKFTNYTRLIREQDTLGQTDIYRTGIKEGRREVMQAIHNMIEWKESPSGNTRG
jgi:hypothetical protein